MRSRSNSTESPTRPKLSQKRPKDHYKEEVDYNGRENVQRRQKKDDAAQASTILRSPKGEKKQRSPFEKREDLSRDDLLFLLSVLEGELQVIYCLNLYSRLKHASSLHPKLPQIHMAFMLTLISYRRTNINCKVHKPTNYSYQPEKVIFTPPINAKKIYS